MCYVCDTLFPVAPEPAQAIGFCFLDTLRAFDPTPRYGFADLLNLLVQLQFIHFAET